MAELPHRSVRFPASARRRRQRSVRVLVASALIAAAAVLVAAGLLTSSIALLQAGAVVSVLCGAAATRITWTEVLQSRREGARARAAQAAAYRDLFEARGAEQVAFARVMRDRVDERERTIRQLEGHIVGVERRVHRAEERVRVEVARADRAEAEVRDLTEQLAARTAEEADELASWEGWPRDDDSVVELAQWDERASQQVPPQTRRKRA